MAEQIRVLIVDDIPETREHLSKLLGFEGDIDVMAIDNGWLSVFWETGWLGVGLVLLALIAAVVAVARAPTPYVRAAAAFLIVYVAIASITETGLSDLSSQTLHLLLAAAAAYADRFLVRGEPLMLPTSVSRLWWNSSPRRRPSPSP